MKSLPHSKEAEDMLIGQCLIDPSMVPQAMDAIKEPDAFYQGDCKLLWDILCNLQQNGEEITLPRVLDNIPEKEKGIIGAYELTSKMDGVHTSATAMSNAKLILEKWHLRVLIKQTHRITEGANGSTSNANQIVDEVHKTIGKIINLRPTQKFDLSALIAETVEKIYDERSLIKFGYGKIDEITGGMTRGEITVLAGRPSMGKSTIAVNVIKRLIENGNKVIIFNREMTNIEMMKKLLILESETGVSYKNMRVGALDEREDEILNESMKKVSEKYKNLLMFDNIQNLQAGVNEIKKFKPDVIVDDYIQMVRVPHIDDKRLQVVEIMQHYKWIAKSENCSALLLSQINREVERHRDKRPNLAHLSESGAIETDAETVIFIYYDWKYSFLDNPHGKDGKYMLELLVRKNRYGETGYAEMGFYGDGCLLTETSDIAINIAKQTGEYRGKGT